MLGGALGRLFLDLDRVAPAERSGYEAALHGELLDLAIGRRPAGDAGRVSPRDVRSRISDAVSRLKVDLGPSADDARRIHCVRPDCPNKVR